MAPSDAGCMPSACRPGSLPVATLSLAMASRLSRLSMGSPGASSMRRGLQAAQRGGQRDHRPALAAVDAGVAARQLP